MGSSHNRYNLRQNRYIQVFKDDNIEKVKRMRAEVKVLKVQLETMADFGHVYLKTSVYNKENGGTENNYQSFIWDYLVDFDSINGYGLVDTLNLTQSKCQSGLTGSGSIKNLSRAVRREVEMSVALQEAFCSVLQSSKDVVWSYYVSASGFINMAPWVPISQYYFKDSIDKQMSYLIGGSPHLNAQGHFFFSKPYVSMALNEILFDYGKPLYFNNEWLGNLGISFAATKLSKFLMSKNSDDENDNYNYFKSSKYIINSENTLLGTNGEQFFSDNTIMDVQQIVADSLKGIDFFNEPDGVLIENMGHYYMKTIFYEQLAVLTMVKKNTIKEAVIRDIIPEILISILGIILVLGYVKMNTLLRIKDKLFRDVNIQKNELMASEQSAALGKLLSNVTNEFITPKNAIEETNEKIAEAFENLSQNWTDNFTNIDNDIIQAILTFKIANRQVLKNPHSLDSKSLRIAREQLEKKFESENLKGLRKHMDYLIRLPLHFINSQIEKYDAKSMQLIVNFSEIDFDLINGFDSIDLSSAKINRMIKTLTNYSVIKPFTEYVYFNLSESIYRVVKRLKQTEYKSVVIDVSDVDKELIVKGAQDEIEECIQILIMNGVEASDFEGKMVVTLKKKRKLAVLTVQDFGVGIKEEDLDKIYEPFYTTKDYGEATGLSLDILKRTLKRHEVNIYVESEPRNTKFFMSFKLDKNQ